MMQKRRPSTFRSNIMASSSSSTLPSVVAPGSNSIRDKLASEQPKIDSALKSFASLIVATGDFTLTDGLAITRKVSQHINQHIVPIRVKKKKSKRVVEEEEDDDDDDAPSLAAQQQEAVAQVWNELVASRQKPTKVLGRTSLQTAWDDLEWNKVLEEQPDDEWNKKLHSYLLQFHSLLLRNNDTSTNPDAHLLWDVDRGAAELARRAADRQQRATDAVKQQQQEEAATPFIQELSPADDNKDE